jgi:hypothetical protein
MHGGGPRFSLSAEKAHAKYGSAEAAGNSNPKAVGGSFDALIDGVVTAIDCSPAA